MKIKRFLKALKYKLEHTPVKLIDSKLCGIDLKTTPGTIRNYVDQDDAWFFYLARHHHVIYDIGCNVGYTALLALIQEPNRPYILVDPNPKALNLAQLNLVSNNLGFKAQYFSGFVSNTSNETLKFYTIGAGAAGSMYSSHAQSAAAINSFTNVKTVTLDNLYHFYKVKPDLVKIDVEGAETQVMEGAFEVARETQCTFFVEMHDLQSLEMESAGQLILDWCAKSNYKAWYLKSGEALVSASVIKGRGKCHLLLQPNDKPYPSYLLSISQNAPLPNLS